MHQSELIVFITGRPASPPLKSAVEWILQVALKLKHRSGSKPVLWWNFELKQLELPADCLVVIIGFLNIRWQHHSTHAWNDLETNFLLYPSVLDQVVAVILPQYTCKATRWDIVIHFNLKMTKYNTMHCW